MLMDDRKGVWIRVLVTDTEEVAGGVDGVVIIKRCRGGLTEHIRAPSSRQYNGIHKV